MAFKIYWGTALIGGGIGALDAIDGAELADKYAAVIIRPTKADFYSLDADSGLAEDPPHVIKPLLNAGLKRWIRTFGSDELPDGTDTGDIIRWNADTGAWESCAEPFEFESLILTPTDIPPVAVQGGMYFNLSQNAVYVGVT